jgi:bud site selection protein 31
MRKCEALWPVHQINWQRRCVLVCRHRCVSRRTFHLTEVGFWINSRYIFDMYYKYKKITREVYDYCVQMVRALSAESCDLPSRCLGR